MSSDDSKLLSVDYEVFGRVQGVCFRAYTQETATRNKLVGWVKNTRSGTVIGIVQGPKGRVKEMKNWLKNTGSPSSKISNCEFKNEREIPALEFKHFCIE